eukprot:6513714-Heterocapsa_arctica.AAC.1
MLERVVGSSKLVSSLDFVQNDERCARNLMVIARMPEDRSETFKNPLTNIQSHIHLRPRGCEHVPRRACHERSEAALLYQ